MVNRYRCNVIEDESKSLIFRGICNNHELSKFPQFVITELVEIKPSLITV